MRYFLTASLLLYSIFSFARNKELPSSFVKKLPVPHKAVNDFSRFITSSERTTLDLELKSYLKRTSNAIVIVTLDSLTDPKTKKEYTVEEAASLYFNTWGIGDSIKNNGVLLLASRKPRRIRIEVGQGLSTVLDDYFCQSIIDSNLVPAFKKDYYFTGFKEAITALENRLDNPPAPKPAAEFFTTIEKPAPTSSGLAIMKGFFRIIEWIFGFIFIVILAMLGRGNRYSDRYYNRHGCHHGYWSPYDNDRWNNNSSSFSSSNSSSSFFSGSSDSSSSSSSSDSYSGGSSSGGGASGSW